MKHLPIRFPHRSITHRIIIGLMLGFLSVLQAQQLAKDAVENLQERYIRGFKDTILVPYQASKWQLDEKFLEVLNKDLELAKQSGDLDHLVATQAHLDALEQGKPLPAEQDSFPESLASLRNIYLSQVEAMNEVVLEKTRPLLPHINQAYKTLEVQFTQKGLMDEALVLRDARNALKTEGLTFLPFPEGVRSPLLGGTEPSPEVKPLKPLQSGDGLPFIDFMNLPAGTVRVLLKDGLKITEELAPGGDHKDRAVKVLCTPHFSQYVTNEGNMIGHMAPHQENNSGLIQFSTSYLFPMALNQEGKVVFSRRVTVLPKGLDPASLVKVKSIASNSHAAAVLFEDGSIQAWSVGRDEEPELLKLGRMHDDLTALWATGRVIFGRRASNQRFEIVYSPVDASDFRRDLNRSKFKFFDASPHSNFVIGVTERSGEVEIVSEGKQDPPNVPPNLGIPVQVRAGNSLFATQHQDGRWKLWGDRSVRDLIQKYNQLAGDVIDVGFTDNRIMWIER